MLSSKTSTPPTWKTKGLRPQVIIGFHPGTTCWGSHQSRSRKASSEQDDQHRGGYVAQTSPSAVTTKAQRRDHFLDTAKKHQLPLPCAQGQTPRKSLQSFSRSHTLRGPSACFIAADSAFHARRKSKRISYPMDIAIMSYER